MESQEQNSGPAVEQDVSDSPSMAEMFDGEIAHKRVSLLYQLGLSAVALMLLLLPALYLGLIALVGYGICYHMAHNLSWLESGHHGSGPTLADIVLYFAPVVSGAILIFFMFKPFFARRQQHFQPMDISSTEHPMLFALIEKICHQIGAPVPKRVDVNCDVNASASFRRGLLSLFGQDVVLTVGLPLVAGLDVREFAGVLAHEFGHFAQGTAMRLTYVIRRINSWFGRVVYERDQWDAWLYRASRQRDIRLSAVFLVARLGIWLSRRVLWVFMYLAHGISCFLLRQMEYDADNYGIQLAGTDGFISTSKRLQVLSFAAQEAYNELDDGWKRRRVPDSLPVFIGNKADLVPQEIRTKIEESTSKAETKLFNTHPSAADRIRQAERMRAAGVFRAIGPATTLFHRFDDLARNVTLMHYQQGLRLPLRPEHLVPVEETVRESRGQTEGEQAIRQFLHGQFSVLRPIVIVDRDITPPKDPDESIQNLVAARQRMKQSPADVEPALKVFLDADTKLIQACLATQLLTAGCKIQPAEFHLAAATLEAAKKATSENERRQNDAVPRLQAFEADTTIRLISALRLLHSPQVAEGIKDVERLRVQATELTGVLPKLVSVYPLLLALRQQFLGIQVVSANRSKCPEPGRADFRVNKLAQDAQQNIQAIQTKLAHVRYPFQHAKTELSLADYAMPDRSDDNSVARTYQQASSHLERLFKLYTRILGQLVLIAVTVEDRFNFAESEQPQSGS